VIYTVEESYMHACKEEIDKLSTHCIYKALGDKIHQPAADSMYNLL
jgi:hypothetical protein